MKKVLVFCVNWVGDIVFLSPAFKAIKDQYPGVQVSCLAVERVREILECVPGIDEIINYEEDGHHKSVIGKLELTNYLRKQNFDACFLVHRSFTKALMVYSAGIKARIGYDTKKRGKLLTHCIPYEQDVAHRSDEYLYIFEAFGIKINNKQTTLIVHPDTDQRAKEILKENGILPEDKFIILNPGANWDLKRWPIKSFVELVDKIRKLGNYKIVITGSSHDSLAFKDLLLLESQDVINLLGKTTLKELVGVIKLAKIFVSADSGPLHIASSVGTSSIALFGPTLSALTGPRGSGESIVLRKNVGCNKKACYYLDCPDNTCMKAISTEDVINAIKQIKN